MKYLHRYIQWATNIIQTYPVGTPLAIVLKNFYKLHKQMGSADRKNVSKLVYAYYRLGKGFSQYTITEKIAIGMLLTEDNVDFIVDYLPQAFKPLVANILVDRKKNLQEHLLFLFPLLNEVSSNIEKPVFINHHLQQPLFFLRIRPGFEKKVITVLAQNAIAYTSITSNCISLSTAIDINSLLVLNKEVVVQDYASQQIALLLQQIKNNTNNNSLQLWDCCAASGGKTILAKDIFSKVQITVSDIRPSIIHNLKKRLQAAAVNIFGAYVADASKPVNFAVHNSFDVIMADVPCSGSGTWSRSPEQLVYFTEQQLHYFNSLQQKIVHNTWQYVKKGGYFLYITCSVYKQENEQVISFLQKQYPEALLIQQAYLKGYTLQADTMFACLLQKTVS